MSTARPYWSCPAGERYGQQVTLRRGSHRQQLEGSADATPTGVQGIVQGFLTGVSCTSVTACSAAGDHFNDAGVQVPLMESWNRRPLEDRVGSCGARFHTVSGISCPVAGVVRRRRPWTPTSTQYATAGDGDSYTLVGLGTARRGRIRSTPD